MSAVKVFGLKTCETCRKALKALDANGVEVAFHDVRAEGVSKKQIEKWASAVGWENLLNKASTSWRALPESEKADVGKAQAVALMAKHPTLIKRPVIERGPTEVHVGWSNDTWKAVL